jgi:hypothetical protein
MPTPRHPATRRTVRRTRRSRTPASQAAAGRGTLVARGHLEIDTTRHVDEVRGMAQDHARDAGLEVILSNDGGEGRASSRVSLQMTACIPRHDKDAFAEIVTEVSVALGRSLGSACWVDDLTFAQA